MDAVKACHRDFLTQHCRTRLQQRGIPRMMIDYIMEFGECRTCGRGAESYFFTKKSWRQLTQYAGSATKYLERWRNIYVVVADGVVVTAAFRH